LARWSDASHGTAISSETQRRLCDIAYSACNFPVYGNLQVLKIRADHVLGIPALLRKMFLDEIPVSQRLKTTGVSPLLQEAKSPVAITW
jgi:hypothetical protein